MVEKRTKIEDREQASIHNWAPVNERGESKSSDEIEHDIEETRNQMDTLLDELAYKMSPGRVVNRYKEKTRKANKLPLLLMASGAAWMVYEIQKQDGKHNGRHHKGYYRERVQPGEQYRYSTQEESQYPEERTPSSMESAKEKGKEYQSRFQQGTESVKERAQDTLNIAKERGEQAQQRAYHFREQAMERSREAVQRTNKTVHENPLLAGVTALFAGMIAGLILPVSEMEKRTVGKRVHGAFKQAKETGEQALERGKRIAGAATEAAREEAQKQGLTPEETSQKAKEPGKPQEKAADIGTKAAETVKGTAQRAEEKLKEEQNRGRKAA